MAPHKNQFDSARAALSRAMSCSASAAEELGPVDFRQRVQLHHL